MSRSSSLWTIKSLYRFSFKLNTKTGIYFRKDRLEEYPNVSMYGKGESESLKTLYMYVGELKTLFFRVLRGLKDALGLEICLVVIRILYTFIHWSYT